MSSLPALRRHSEYQDDLLEFLRLELTRLRDRIWRLEALREADRQVIRQLQAHRREDRRILQELHAHCDEDCRILQSLHAHRDEDCQLLQTALQGGMSWDGYLRDALDGLGRGLDRVGLQVEALGRRTAFSEAASATRSEAGRELEGRVQALEEQVESLLGQERGESPQIPVRGSPHSV